MDSSFLIHLKTAKKMTNLEQFCNNVVFCLNSSLGSCFSPKTSPKKNVPGKLYFLRFSSPAY